MGDPNKNSGNADNEKFINDLFADSNSLVIGDDGNIISHDEFVSFYEKLNEVLPTELDLEEHYKQDKGNKKDYSGTNIAYL